MPSARRVLRLLPLALTLLLALGGAGCDLTGSAVPRDPGSATAAPEATPTVPATPPVAPTRAAPLALAIPTPPAATAGVIAPTWPLPLPPPTAGQGLPRPTNTPWFAPTGTAATDQPPPAAPALVARVAAFAPLRTIPSGPVQVIAWAPDGRTLATAAGNTVQWWDVASGRLLHSVYLRNASSLAWSPDGQSLAAGGDLNTVLVLDPATAGPRRTFTGSPPEPAGQNSHWADQLGFVTALAWSLDGRTLAAGGQDPTVITVTVRLWNPATGQLRRALAVGGDGGPTNIAGLAWSPDGRRLGASAGDTVVLWDAATGRPITTIARTTVHPASAADFEETFDVISNVAWSPNGATIALGHRSSAGARVALWDAAGTHLLRTMPIDSAGATAPIGALAWAADGGLLAALVSGLDPQGGTALSNVRLCDPISATCLRTLPASDAATFAWAPRGDLLAIPAADGVILWGAAPPQATVAPAGPPAACADGWRAAAGGPALPAYAVAAGATDDVWVVGNNVSNRADSLAQHWDGRTWQAVPVATLGPGYHALRALARVARDDVWAAGFYESAGLLEHWDGQSWRVAAGAAAGAAGTTWQALAATGPADIWVAGSVVVPGPILRTSTRLAHWDGRQWRTVPSPNPGGWNELYGLAAAGPADVWAVGTTRPCTALWQCSEQPLVLHWDGRTWQVATQPQVGGSQAALFGIAAIAADDVWAVGEIAGGGVPQALVLHWNGRTWTHEETTPALEATSLFGITARDVHDIWAVGLQGTRAQIRHWNGAAWQTILPASAAAGDLPDGPLVGVAALTSTDIWAVGGGNPRVHIGPEARLVLHFGAGTCPPPAPPTAAPGAPAAATPACGTWSTVPSPNAGATHNELLAVAAHAADDVWAAGFASNSQVLPPDPASDRARVEQPLIEHWDGRGWLVVPSPAGRAQQAQVRALAVLSGRDAWAVGVADTDLLILHWDGQRWLTVPGPQIGAAGGELNAIAAVGPADIWAVGASPPVAPGQDRVASTTLVLHWDGLRWARVASPSPGLFANTLQGLAIRGPADIWAVGSHVVGQGSGGTADWAALALHWDGRRWTLVPTPGVDNLGGDHQLVAAVATAGGLWALDGNMPAADRGAIVRWDGLRWTGLAIPPPAAQMPPVEVRWLRAITATSRGELWAAGTDGTEGDLAWRGQGLVLHGDGASWSPATLPASGTETWLSGVAAVGPDTVWAVGSQGAGADYNTRKTLTLRYATGPCAGPPP